MFVLFASSDLYARIISRHVHLHYVVINLLVGYHGEPKVNLFQNIRTI